MSESLGNEKPSMPDRDIEMRDGKQLDRIYRHFINIYEGCEDTQDGESRIYTLQNGRTMEMDRYGYPDGSYDCVLSYKLGDETLGSPISSYVFNCNVNTGALTLDRFIYFNERMHELEGMLDEAGSDKTMAYRIRFEINEVKNAQNNWLRDNADEANMSGSCDYAASYLDAEELERLLEAAWKIEQAVRRTIQGKDQAD